jgi:Putative restriction endonuclease
MTLAEFLQQPETKPASEYIDGQIIQKPMPQGEHSTLQGDLVTSINAIVKPRRIARAYPELRCTFGGQAIVPDVAVFLWDRIPRKEDGTVENQFAIAPDWSIEILSRDISWSFPYPTLMLRIQRGLRNPWLHSSWAGQPLSPPCALFILRVMTHRRADRLFCGGPFSVPTRVTPPILLSLILLGRTFPNYAGSDGCRHFGWRLHQYQHLTLLALRRQPHSLFERWSKTFGGWTPQRRASHPVVHLSTGKTRGFPSKS